MKQSSYKGKSPLPDFVIDAACAGNAEAVERVLQHYDGYINKLCISVSRLFPSWKGA